MLKRFQRSPVALGAVGGTLARYIRLVHRTARITRQPPDLEARLFGHAPAIVAFWHGQFLMVPAVKPPGLPVRAIVARHGDAALIGAALERFGIGLIRGAGAGTRRRDKGGAQALRQAMRALAEGTSIAMTADVPPGPARVAGIGIVTLAQLSGRPVVPVAIATQRFHAFRNWSRLTLNLPWSDMAVVMGEPVYVPRDASPAALEEARLAVEAGLNRATSRAYAMAGADLSRATPAAAKPGLILRLYRAGSAALTPAAGIFLEHRKRRGKEVPSRMSERIGVAGRPRPDGPLWWFHAASVGETNAILPLIRALRAARPRLSILLTTVTVTSSQVAATRLPPGAIHQFVPLDTPIFVGRFLEHWRPDMALFTESEIWPNLILEADQRGVPLALLNARMSERSYRRFAKRPGFARPLFSRFAILLAQNARLAKRLTKLGARNVIVAGNIKFDAPPPAVDRAELERLLAAIAGRPVIVAASTHPGENQIVADAHRLLAKRLPGLITLIVPRHPDRGPAIAALMAERGLSAVRRAPGNLPGPKTDIYIGDTINELGLFYAAAPAAFIGGSLVPQGGQNPVEAIKLGAAVITGPEWQNFREAYGALVAGGGCLLARDACELAEAFHALLTDAELIERTRAAADETVAQLSGALGRTLAALEPFLPPAAAAPALAPG